MKFASGQELEGEIAVAPPNVPWDPEADSCKQKHEPGIFRRSRADGISHVKG
jgi:hypothetical protein